MMSATLGPGPSQLACFCQFAACITGSQEIGECANTISCIADQVRECCMLSGCYRPAAP